jgi:hypothetical protein
MASTSARPDWVSMIPVNEQPKQPADRAAFFDFDAMIALAELWGWDPETSFVIAAQLKMNGITASQAALDVQRCAGAGAVMKSE